MDELVLFLAKSLVSLPEEVSVNTKQDGDCTVIELHVAEQDMGKVIGRQGRIAKAIRTIVRAASLRENRKYTVEII
ncbi:MAG: KH domain-containing protein [Clostridia bacterium]|nr:KH domain-containing protein [Clostridia bacterium]MBR0444315.1 KH domain-containing protein [Clostridia bacterium]